MIPHILGMHLYSRGVYDRMLSKCQVEQSPRFQNYFVMTERLEKVKREMQSKENKDGTSSDYSKGGEAHSATRLSSFPQSAARATMLSKPPSVHGSMEHLHQKRNIEEPHYSRTDWVIKRYLPAAIDCITSTGQTLAEHTKKTVQIHSLARNFAQQLESEVDKNWVLALFGEFPKYRQIFYGETDQEELVTIKKFIPGVFTKYINNTGMVCGDPNDAICQKAERLVHYFYHKSKKKLMLMDIQGNGFNLFDPEIGSS
eukprot:gene2326-2678_t